MTSIYIQTILNAPCSEAITGEWLDVTNCTQNDITQAVSEALDLSKNYLIKRWEIGDYDGFYGLTPPVETVIEVATLVNTYGEAYALYAMSMGYDILDDFEEAYCGEWNSFKDYATELFEDVYGYNLCDYVRSLIDYDLVAQDFKMDYFYEPNQAGNVCVFRNL